MKLDMHIHDMLLTLKTCDCNCVHRMEFPTLPRWIEKTLFKQYSEVRPLVSLDMFLITLIIKNAIENNHHYLTILTIKMATKQAKVVFQSPLAVAEALPTRTL